MCRTGISAIGFGAKLGLEESFESTSAEGAPKTWTEIIFFRVSLYHFSNKLIKQPCWTNRISLWKFQRKHLPIIYNGQKDVQNQCNYTYTLLLN